jgi:SAM-dependent methyltransferase
MTRTLTPLDRFLQWWRIRKALQHIPAGGRVCDIGTYDGRLFAIGREDLASGVGIDPDLVVEETSSSFSLRRGLFPDALDTDDTFDAITALAVLEHIPRTELQRIADAVHDRLKGNGVFVITCPMPIVDQILSVLMALRLVRGQSLEQHYGLHPDELIPIFGRRMSLVVKEHFQLGVNRLLVFRKRS